MDDMPDSSSGVSGKPDASATSGSKVDDVYEFKTTSSTKETLPMSRTVSPATDQSSSDKGSSKDSANQQTKDDKKGQQQAGEKRLLDADQDEDEIRKKKLRREEIVGSSTTGGPSNSKDLSSKIIRGTRGGSTDKVLTSKVGGAKARALVAADRKSPLSVSNSPKKPPSRDHSDSDNDDENSKKSTDSSGLKVPPLKIVLSNQGNGNGNGVSNMTSGSVMPGQTPSNTTEQEPKRTNLGCGGVSNDPTPATSGNDPVASSSSSSGSGSGSGSLVVNYERESRPTSSYTDYHVKKRKLRSQVEDSYAASNANGSGSNTASSANTATNQSQVDPNKNVVATGSGVLTGNGGPTRTSSEPLNDIEKFLNIRRQVEQRRRNLFHVQPKPPQGFKDYLMNRKTYLLHENAPERLRSIPMIQPPPSLEGPLRDLFKSQEEERYKLRMKHLVEKEKLVLAVEQEILRVHGRAARALANQSLPYSVCTILRDEEIYTPIDPQQEEKNRDIRSRYNGRLFLSWLQDVDDKWEKIKEQMVLRHHNEAESLNAVQKMDWEWKVKELSGTNPTNSETLPPIDDLYIPMVHVSDDFDLDRT